MNRPGSDPDATLEASLRRINGALERNRNEYTAMVDQIMAATRAEVAERDALAARIANEQDEIVRDRLGQALRALEQQLVHRAELTTAAARRAEQAREAQRH